MSFRTKFLNIEKIDANIKIKEINLKFYRLKQVYMS